MVNESTKLTEPAHVYLLEDALELWLAVLETSQAPDPVTLQLAENLYPILGRCCVNVNVFKVTAQPTLGQLMFS